MSHGVCRGHKDEVVRVAWHPTMRILASGSADGAVAVWKVASPGAERAASAHDPDEPSVARVDVIGPHPGEVYGCAFVGDGEGGGPMLATAAGADLRLWDLEAAVEVARVPPVRAAKDGSDFRVPADASGPAKKKTPERWEGGHLFSLSSDGGARGLLASACSDGTVKLWGLDAGARAATAVASVASHPNALATATTFLPGGNLLASAGGDGKVVVCDVRASCKAVRRITPPCVATGLCVFVAPKTRVGVGGGAHDEHRECRSKARPRKERGTWRCAAETASCAPSPARARVRAGRCGLRVLSQTSPKRRRLCCASRPTATARACSRPGTRVRRGKSLSFRRFVRTRRTRATRVRSVGLPGRSRFASRKRERIRRAGQREAARGARGDFRLGRALRKPGKG